MPLRTKYPIMDWVLGQDNVAPGDTIAFICDESQEEVHAEVLDFPSKEMRQYISCRRHGSNIAEIINFYNTIVYRIKQKSPTLPPECSCGAKHTSNPKFHLSFCDLKSA